MPEEYSLLPNKSSVLLWSHHRFLVCWSFMGKGPDSPRRSHNAVQSGQSPCLGIRAQLQWVLIAVALFDCFGEPEPGLPQHLLWLEFKPYLIWVDLVRIPYKGPISSPQACAAAHRLGLQTLQGHWHGAGPKASRIHISITETLTKRGKGVALEQRNRHFKLTIQRSACCQAPSPPLSNLRLLPKLLSQG